MEPEVPADLRVLLVDDDVVDRLAVVRAVGKIDVAISVRETSSAEDALEALRRGHFDCVISDLHMPGRDGAWLLAAMKRENIDVPFVVLTGQGDEQTAVDMLKAGAADYAPKSAVSANRVGHILRHAVRVHRAEREARLTEERLRLAVQATGVGIWEWDPRTDDLRCDDRCRALFGLPPQAVLTYAAAMAAVHPEDLARTQEAAARVLERESGARFDNQYRVIGIGDSRERWLRAMGKVFFQDGKAVRAVGTLQDVTRQRRDEESARRRLEFEQQLIGIVSHDLRNPLSAMVMGASILKRALPPDSPLVNTANRIVGSGERASRLIRDLLDFTQVRTGAGIPIERRPADIHLVCKQTVEEIALNSPGRLIVHQPEGAGDGAWDPDRLSQVVGNLTRNAVAYSPSESPITVRSRDHGARVVVEVHNEGKPIPPEVLPTLFEPFTRGERRSDPDRSIGLGLFIVREIVAAHGGQVAVHSTADHGTTFRIELPKG